MKTVTILHRRTGATLYTTEVDDDDAYPVRTALAGANLADLAYANLAYADLAGADLAGANLAYANLAGANLAGANLAGANLAYANLAYANLADANLGSANLGGANLGGANLADANLAGADLADANLGGANLADANLAGADLADADLADAYLGGANLADANLADANLAGANLAGANLAGAKSLPACIVSADSPTPYVRAAMPSREVRAERARAFREANPHVPVVENLDSKVLAAVTVDGGRLEMATWHTCGTTHCRGGWAVTLAGEAGQVLEREVGEQRAAELIYRASTGRVPHFFASNYRAMEDIRACAEQEGGGL